MGDEPPAAFLKKLKSHSEDNDDALHDQQQRTPPHQHQGSVSPVGSPFGSPIAAAENNDDGPCLECTRLVGELKQHIVDNHAARPVAVQKSVIRAWFETHYARNGGGGGGGTGEIPVSVSRMTLLREINTFLDHMGYPRWKTQTSMYKDWFLRQVMALSDDDIRKGRGWSLHYRDGFAPGGKVEDARDQQQRMNQAVERLQGYMMPN